MLVGVFLHYESCFDFVGIIRVGYYKIPAARENLMILTSLRVLG